MKLSIRKSSAETDKNKLIKEGYGEIADYVSTENANEIMEKINNYDDLKSELTQLIRFKEYFDELYGTNLDVANWHLNGDLEPFDIFYENAVEYMNEKR